MTSQAPSPADDAALVAVSAAETPRQLADGLAEAAAQIGCAPDAARTLGEGRLNAVEVVVHGCDVPAARAALKTVFAGAPVDVCATLVKGRRKALLLCDMDSTIIGQECLDELADFAGLKAEVAAITERAMRGELDFEGALTTRVAMLKGLPAQALQRCYDERVSLNPGAERLVRTMAKAGARCVLVSGGFTFFTARVAKAAGFHADRANVLLQEGGVLTGEVARPILGREAKLAALQDEARALGRTPLDAVCLGDGANDLAMIEASGLGVAYRAKPVVAARAAAAIDHTDLTAALFYQGFAEKDFA